MIKTKIILFDIDGVLIRPPHYFSIELEKQGFQNVEKDLNSFYKSEDSCKCSEGKKSAEKLILPFLQKFGWQKTVEQYYSEQFNFEKNFLDQDLIAIIEKIKNQNIKCFLATDQEKNRANFLLESMNFKNIFSQHFISCYVGYRKCHDEFWLHTIKKIKKDFRNIKANEIIFFDDIQNNLNVASKFGINTFLFTDMFQFKKDLKSLNFF